jgi:hypothetical protein
MSKEVTKFPIRTNLRDHETLEVELPAFLLRALEYRVRKINAEALKSEQVSLNHLIEIQLAESVSIAEIAYLEQDLPGVGAAVSRWLAESE